MSAIGGVFHRSGETPSTQIPRRLAEALRSLGPDSVRYEYSTRVGMMLGHFNTGCEEDETAQPKVCRDGLIITFDGWLDNTDDLRSAIDTNALVACGDASPIELVSEVYRRWGVEGFRRLVGNFALALWDPHQGRLVLATDSLGFRPLYYHVTDEQVVWSSRARALAETLDLELKPEPDFIAAFLANSITDRGPFVGIESLPGGHVLVADHHGVQRHRYWNFDPSHEIRYSSDQQYEEHFAELFEQAVACRLRGGGPIFSELSGGVDSSSIVCLADELMRTGRVPERPLHTISYVFDQATTADERPYIREIEKATRVTPHHFREEDHPILSKRPPAGWGPDLPTNQISYLARYDRVSELMQSHGSRILLSGLGGDQCVFAEDLDVPLELADLWVEGKPTHMLRAAYRWARSRQRPLLQTLWQGAVVPLRPAGWRTRSRQRPIGDWLKPDFLDRTDFRDRTLGPGDDLGFRLRSRGFQYSVLRQTMRVFALQKCVSQGHFEVRYPYLDRRLLEFTLAIPIDQHLRPHETRSVVRRALKGRMPQSVLERRTKAGPTEAFQRALVRERQWVGSLFEDSLLEGIGVIDGAAFRSALGRARHGLVSQPAQMHRTVSLELWLRSMSSSTALSRPQTEPSSTPETANRSDHRRLTRGA